jgi:hypothetical protein
VSSKLYKPTVVCADTGYESRAALLEDVSMSSRLNELLVCVIDGKIVSVEVWNPDD